MADSDSDSTANEFSRWVRGCTAEPMCEGTVDSHLTGGFTTITDIFDGSPDAVVDQRCSPPRSNFQVVGFMDTPSYNTGDDTYHDHESNLGTFASYYDMQKNGPHSPDAHNIIGSGQIILKQYDIDDESDKSIDMEVGGKRFFEQQHALTCRPDGEDDHTSKGGRSSLSSITNEFYFPKFNGKGRFINYGSRKDNVSTKKKNNSNPKSSKDRKSPSSYTKDTSTTHVIRGGDGIVATNTAPWYSFPRIQLEPHFHHDDSERREEYIQEKEQSNAHLGGQRPLEVSRPPSEVLISHFGHANPLVKVPHSSSQTPSVISSSDLSQYFTNELRDRYNSIIHRSYRNHYYQFINSTCAKKSIVALVSISLIAAMITTTSIVLGRHVPRAWTDSVNITLVIPGRDGIPYACCVDGMYVPQDGNTNLHGDQENSSDNSSTTGIGSVFEESGLISFSSSQGGVEPTNNPVPTLQIPAPTPSLQVTHPSPTGSPTIASLIFESLEATPTAVASDSPVLLPGLFDLDSSIVRIKSVDTTIDELRPNVNYGDEPYLSLKGRIKVALVKFDLSVLNGRQFNKATLVLHSLLNEQEDLSTSKVTVGVLPQAGDWNEASLTWRDAGSSRTGSFVVNQFQFESSQIQRHEVDVLRAVENSLLPTFESIAPSDMVTFELFTESGSIVQFASREWNEGILQPELLVYLSDDSPSTTLTRIPSTYAPSASPVTSIPSVEMSLSPSATTHHPSEPMSQIPSAMTSESPTASPFNPTASPMVPTITPHNPTASPSIPTVYPSHPSNAPTVHPTSSPEAATRVPVQVALKVFDVCPDERVSSMKHARNDLVSYQSGSVWQVYQCADNHCSAAGQMLGAANSDSSWILVGTCRNGPPEQEDFTFAPVAPTPFPSHAPASEPSHEE